MSLATSCVHCGTVFRVAEEQLKASEGWVRCGHCQQVFNALESLFDLRRGGTPDAAAPSAPLPVPSPAATGFRYSESFTGAFQAPVVVPRSALVGAPTQPSSPIEASVPPAPAVADPHDPSWLETRPAAFSDLEALRRHRDTDGFLSGGDQDRPEGGVAPALDAPVLSLSPGARREEPIPTSAFLRRAGVDLGGTAEPDRLSGAHAPEGPESVYVEDPREGPPTAFEPTLWTVGWIPPASGELPPVRSNEVREPAPIALGEAQDVATQALVAEPDLPVPSNVPAPVAFIQTDPEPTAEHVPDRPDAPALNEGRREPVFDTDPPDVDIPVTVMEPIGLSPELYTVMAEPALVSPVSADLPQAAQADALDDDRGEGGVSAPGAQALDDSILYQGTRFPRASRPVSLDEIPDTSFAVSEFAYSPTLPGDEERVQEEAKPTFVQQAERKARWAHPGVRGLLAGLALAAAATLTVQAAVHWRVQVGERMPSLAPALDRICASVLDCPNPASRADMRLDALVVDSSNLAQPPDGKGYRLQLQLRNRHKREVVAPNVDLTLTDLAGNVVSRRSLTPEDFGQPAVLEPLADLPWQVDFATPGFTVAGYTLAIYYP